GLLVERIKREQRIVVRRLEGSRRSGGGLECLFERRRTGRCRIGRSEELIFALDVVGEPAHFEQLPCVPCAQKRTLRFEPCAFAPGIGAPKNSSTFFATISRSLSTHTM